MSDPWSACEAAQYVSLETFRKDGSGVRTPVWAAPDPEAPDGRLVVWTVADSWKVGRIRRRSSVRLAPCTVGGEITGHWVDAEAAILTHDQSAIAVRALYRKYGIVARVVVAASRLRRGPTGTICLAIMPRGAR